MAFYTTGQLMSPAEGLLKNVWFSEILEENKENHFWKYLELHFDSQLRIIGYVES